MNKEELMYKRLKKDLEDKRILEEEIQGLKDQIKYKIQKQLGLHATTYKELKIECPTVDDKFVRVFSQIEKLDNDLHNLEGELELINKRLDNIDEQMKSMDSIEKKIFRNRYVLGLSVSQTAERLNYSEQHIKRITKEIFQK